MANLYTHQSSNITKTWLLMAIFLVVVVAIGYFFAYTYESPGILYFTVIFSIVMNIMSFWYSDKISLALTGAKPASREEFFDLYTVTENLSIAAGLPMPKLYVIDDPAPNAFATGRNKEHAAVAATTGLLQTLNRTELEGVVAHELSHIGNRDTLLMTVVVVLVGFIAVLSDIFLRGNMFRNRDSDNKAGNVLMLVGIILAILSPIIATLIQLAISRKREFLADASGALLTRYPEGLASALQKISTYPRPMQKVSTATAHLFIANPLGGSDKNHGFFTKLFMTHPLVQERISALLSK